jgi:hypothetical protein
VHKEQGLKEGRMEGRKEGWKEGRKEGRKEDLICIARNQKQQHHHRLFSFPSMVLHSIASFRIYGKTCVFKLPAYSLPSTLLTFTSLTL